MIFSEGTKVTYKDISGSVAFVCDRYLVIEIASSFERKPARLLVYRHNYNLIKIDEETSK